MDRKRQTLPRTPTPLSGVEKVDRLIAVASGKGGVGKTTVAVNLALTLQQRRNASVGSTPISTARSVPIMLDLEGVPKYHESAIEQNLMLVFDHNLKSHAP